MAATVVVTAYYLHGLTLTVAADVLDRSWADRPAQCVINARTDWQGGAPDRFSDLFQSCLYWKSIQDVLIRAGLVALTLAVAVALYLLHGRREKGLVSLDGMGDTDVVPLVRGVLAEHADLKASVFFHLEDERIEGQTYGLPGSYRIKLSGGLLPHKTFLLGALRHELAHLRNRDVGLTQLTIALWWSFVCTAAAPALLAWAARPGNVTVVLAVAFSAVLLRLERGAVLRTREYHADAAVADPEFSAVLRAMAKADRPHSWFETLRSYHPTWSERVTRREAPGLLLRPQAFDGVVAGILVGFSYVPFANAMGLLWPADTAVRAWTSALPFAVLMAGIGGIAMARAVWGARFHGLPEPRPLAQAAALTLGVLVGQLFLPTRSPLTSWLEVLLHHPPVALCWAVVLFLLMWAFCGWQILLADSWVGAGLGHRAGGGTAFVVAGGGLVFGVWLGFWFNGLQQLRAIFDSWEALGVNYLYLLIDTRFTLVVFAAALLPVLPPLCARLFRGRPSYRIIAVPRVWIVGLAILLSAPAYVFAGLPLQERLARDLKATVGQVGTGAVGGGAGALPLLWLAVLGAVFVALAAVVAAFSARGQWLARHRFPAAFFGALAAAALVGPVMFLHILVAFCGWGGARSCFQAAGLPYKSLMGLSMWTLALALPAAFLLIFLLHPLARRPRPSQRPRGFWSSALLPLRVALTAVTVLLALVSTAEAVTAVRIEQAPPVDQTPPAHLETTLSTARPGTIPLVQACRNVTADVLSGNVRTTISNNLTIVYARYTAQYASTDDPVARTLAEAATNALRRYDIPRAARILLSIDRYCTLTEASRV